MTFRPSDDILEEMSSDTQVSNTSELYDYGEGSQTQEPHLFHSADDESQMRDVMQTGEEGNPKEPIIEEPVEEVKAPDLSELLKNQEEDKNQTIDSENGQDNQAAQDFSIDLSGIQSINSENVDLTENNSQNQTQEVLNETNQDVEKDVDNLQKSTQSLDDGESIDGKLGDEDRIKMVSEIDGSIHSNLDFLVDEQWLKVVNIYRKLHRILFRRGIFILFSILGIGAGVFVQVKANHSGNDKVIDNLSTYNIENFSNKFVTTNLPERSDSGIDVIIPYGVSAINGDEVLAKSNLLSYRGIILPQIASINKNLDNIFSLKDFENGKISRVDLENAVKWLVANDSLNSKGNSLPKVLDSKGQGQSIQGGLVDGFNLGCLFKTKVYNNVCDYYLNMFYKYGKYYNLSDYGADLLSLIKEVKNQHKNVSPVCDMVKEYVGHLGSAPSDEFMSAIKYCADDDQQYVKKMVDFIEIENSLGQPELSNRVFDDLDLNAYKLLSAQQGVYKSLEGASINKMFIVSYLNFVQNLINKDKGTYKYLNPLYMDLLYVFNMDVLYDKLLKKGELSTDLKSQIDQINNGNLLLKNESLLSFISTPNIVVYNEEFLDSAVTERSLEDIFSQYYTMTDHLRIRKVSRVSDTQLRVQAEIFSDKINGIVGESLKATISLYRMDNVLYLDGIKISNQPVFSEILNVYASSSLVTLYAMIEYIDEQVGFWYKVPTNEDDIQRTFCEQLSDNENIALYNCDNSSILLYKGNIEYTFSLDNGVLVSFNISDEELDNAIRDKFGKLLFNRDNTPIVIKSILEYEVEEVVDDNIENKLQLIDQFRIHLKLIPDIYDIQGEDDIFLVEFTLGEDLTLQANYDINTHLLTKISYVACGKTLEIRNLTVELSANNESQLVEILNNPRIFFTRVNQAAFRKYQTMCE